MIDGAPLLLLFCTSLGLSILLVVEVRYRILKSRLARRRNATFAAHKDLYRQSVSVSPFESIDRLWQTLGDLWLKPPAWPRALSVRRLILTGVFGGILFIFTLNVALKLPDIPSFIGGIAAGLILPRLLDWESQRKQTDKFVELLPDAVDMLVRMLRAGLPLNAAVKRVGFEAPKPAGPIFDEVSEWLEVGVPLGDAFLMVNARIQQDDFEFFGVSLSVQNMSGGNLTDTLDNLASIIRERILAGLKARSISAEARMTANTISALPIILLVGMQLVAPDYLAPLVNGEHGYGLITYAIGSFIVGIWVIRSMISRLNVG